MNMDDALHTFIEESRDLLQQMEEALLLMEQEEPGPEHINALFRAAHTIKGSAGLFGLDPIVEFTHVVESVLDRVRNGELPLDEALLALFLKSGDHMAALIDGVADEAPLSDGERAEGEALRSHLNGYLAERLPAARTAGGDAVPSAHDPRLETLGGGEVETDNWHISLRFGRDVLRDGMDPLSFLRYLARLGRIVNLVTVTDALPEFAEMDPEACYLGFEIAFRSDAEKAEIEAVFEFVREQCELRILPPHSRVERYLELIRELPEEELRLGEMLMACGTLTARELDAALAVQTSLGEGGPQPIGEVLVDEQLVQPAVVEAALEKQKQVKERKGDNALIRVDAGKLDQLIDLIGELIIAGAGVSLTAQKSGASDLAESTAVMSRLVEEVRDSALNLRMVPIGATFNRFQRVVRDVSKELGKDIRLEISGAETELDKTVVERIGDPLTHLVRNSMDHGIEAAALRRERGKPEHGTLRLNAYHDSGSIVIEVSDDGGGLDKARILAKAVERGLVAADAVLSDHEIYNLIFEAGFSTASSVSNLSGRGVGMDVVRRNIQALRGTIELDSKEGVGSTTRIRLPLTLAIIDGFLVGVGDATYAIPLDMVEECIEQGALEGNACKGGYLDLRGEVLPFVRLRETFRVRSASARRESVVVVRHEGQKAGLVVDRLLGEFQTVIKPLGRIFGNARGIAGSTILGSGEVALIVDVPGLLKSVCAADAAALQRVQGRGAVALH